MGENHIVDKQFEVIKTEWAMCDQNIGRMDRYIFVIRGWAITVTGAMVGYSIDQNSFSLAALSILFPLSFWCLDALFKSFQHTYIIRNKEIEAYLRSPQFATELAGKKLSFSSPDLSSRFGKTGNKDLKGRFFEALFLRNVLFFYWGLASIVFANVIYICCST